MARTACDRPKLFQCEPTAFRKALGREQIKYGIGRAQTNSGAAANIMRWCRTICANSDLSATSSIGEARAINRSVMSGIAVLATYRGERQRHADKRDRDHKAHF